MKLYRITSPEHTFTDEAETVPSIIAWAGTQADARHKRIAFEVPFKEIKPKHRPLVEVEEVDVPTNKEGLLAFLNENCV